MGKHRTHAQRHYSPNPPPKVIDPMAPEVAGTNATELAQAYRQPAVNIEDGKYSLAKEGWAERRGSGARFPLVDIFSKLTNDKANTVRAFREVLPEQNIHNFLRERYPTLPKKRRFTVELSLTRISKNTYKPFLYIGKSLRLANNQPLPTLKCDSPTSIVAYFEDVLLHIWGSEEQAVGTHVILVDRLAPAKVVPTPVSGSQGSDCEQLLVDKCQSLVWKEESGGSYTTSSTDTDYSSDDNSYDCGGADGDDDYEYDCGYDSDGCTSCDSGWSLA